MSADNVEKQLETELANEIDAILENSVFEEVHNNVAADSLEKLKAIVEAALFSAESPLSILQLQQLFMAGAEPDKADIETVIAELQTQYTNSALELKQVASGFRFQVKQDYSPWVSRLWAEKPQKYTRATLETLAIIAYRQPTTRADIEAIRGVSVSSHIIRTLLEREWIKELGHRDVLGNPTIFGTTQTFLDYFNLKSLADLPVLRTSSDLTALLESMGESLESLPGLESEDSPQQQLPLDFSEEKLADEVLSQEIVLEETQAIVTDRDATELLDETITFNETEVIAEVKAEIDAEIEAEFIAEEEAELEN